MKYFQKRENEYLNPNNQICLKNDAAFLLGGLVLLYLTAGLLMSSVDEPNNLYDVISWLSPSLQIKFHIRNRKRRILFLPVELTQ
jgi:hypothetical protein